MLDRQRGGAGVGLDCKWSGHAFGCEWIVAVLVFEIVTCCAVETVDTCRSPKFTLLGRRTIAGCVVPVPLRLTVSWPPAMLPGTVNVPVRVPEVEGSNVTDI